MRVVGVVVLLSCVLGHVLGSVAGSRVAAGGAHEVGAGAYVVPVTDRGRCELRRDDVVVERWDLDRPARSEIGRSVGASHRYLRPGRLVGAGGLTCTSDVRTLPPPASWLVLPAHGGLGTVVVGALLVVVPGMLARTRSPRGRG
ncbi:hypothetical protein ACOACO_12195 [Nocardioides sp. CPCC 205120]|uniref:hypothetical protein n=1 Tax=Nocardioides sp. CPCC 205120 TaxID=3406462 RepID=UPI003B509999